MRIGNFLIVIFVIILMLVALIAAAVYVYRDAKKYNMNQLLWTLVVLFVPNFLGLVIYLIVRSSANNKIKCTECGKIIEKDYNVCPYCKTEIVNKCSSCNRIINSDWKVCPSCGKEIDVKINNKTSNDKGLKLIIILAACTIILPVILIIIGFISNIMYSQNSFDNFSNIEVGSVSTSIKDKYILSAKYINGKNKSKLINIKEDGNLTLESNINYESGELLAYIYNTKTLDKYEINKGNNTINIPVKKNEEYQIILECDNVKSIICEMEWY